MPLPWPSVLVPSSEMFRLRGGDRSGGESIIGDEQVVEGPGARIAARLTIPCHTRDRILAMRRVLALGRGQTWLVGPIETHRAPWWIDPVYGTPVTYGFGRRDAAIDPTYETHPDTASTLDFRVQAAAQINATQMAIYRFRGGLLSPGMFFEVAGRLHTITSLDTPDPTDPNSGLAVPEAIIISFRPWLRAAAPVGTPIEFGTPRSTMRLASRDTGDLELQLSRYGTVTLDLVEA